MNATTRIEPTESKAPTAVIRGSRFILKHLSPSLVSAQPDSSPPMNMANVIIERDGDGLFAVLDVGISWATASVETSDITVAETRGQGGTIVVPGHGRLYDETDVAEYRDMLNIVVGIVWQTALTATGIYLVLEQWTYLLLCVLLVAATTAFLKLNWYDRMQDYPDDLAAQAILEDALPFGGHTQANGVGT